MPRNKKEAKAITIPGRTVLKFLTEDLIFASRATNERRPFLFDLSRLLTMKELPRGTTDVSPNQRYFVEHWLLKNPVVYDLEQFKPLFAFETINNFYIWLDETYLLTEVEDGNYVVHSLPGGQAVVEYSKTIARGITPYVVDRTMTYQDTNGWIRQFDSLTGKAQHDIVEMPGRASKIATSGRHLAFLRSFQVTVFDIHTAETIWQKPTIALQRSGPMLEAGHITQATIHDSWVVVQTRDQVEVWDFLKDRLVAACPYVATSPCLDPPYLYFVGMNYNTEHKLVKFDVEENSVIVEQDARRGEWIFLAAGHGLLYGGAWTDLSLLNFSTLATVWSIEDFQISGGSSTVVTDQNLAAIPTVDGVKIISVEDGKVLNFFPLPLKNFVLCMDTGSATILKPKPFDVNILEFWHLYDSKVPTHTITVESKTIAGAFAKDNLLVTSHIDGTVNFWDITHITQGLV